MPSQRATSLPKRAGTGAPPLLAIVNSKINRIKNAVKICFSPFFPLDLHALFAYISSVSRTLIFSGGQNARSR